MPEITQALCNSWKQEILQAEHDHQVAGHSFKMALYLVATATLNKGTTAYTATGEVAAGGNYATTGATLTNIAPALDTDSAILDWVDETWSASTITAEGALIYNDTHAGDASVIVLNFGGTKISSNGDFTVQFPVAAAATAIIRIT